MLDLFPRTFRYIGTESRNTHTVSEKQWHIIGKLACHSERQRLTCILISSLMPSGVLPANLAIHSSLKSFMLSSNAVSGTISAEFASFVWLNFFDISVNQISGSSSPAFASWSNLILFSVFSNPLNFDLGLVQH